MKIGFTERGDAGLDLSWVDKVRHHVVDGAILITKQLTPKFMDALLRLWEDGYHNLILHCTCTGWGGTMIEPNVPPYQEQLAWLEGLIKKGFPKEHCVLRIDPIWPTASGLQRALSVIHAAQAMLDIKGIRIRISVLDEYSHVKERIQNCGYKPIYGESMFAPKRMMASVSTTLKTTGLTFECCAEPYLTGKQFEQIGCLSGRDLKIMGLPDAGCGQNPQNRKGCLCLSYKEELLSHRHPCGHKCLYCYWKDEG